MTLGEMWEMMQNAEGVMPMPAQNLPEFDAFLEGYERHKEITRVLQFRRGKSRFNQAVRDMLAGPEWMTAAQIAADQGDSDTTGVRITKIWVDEMGPHAEPIGDIRADVPLQEGLMLRAYADFCEKRKDQEIIPGCLVHDFGL